MDETEMTGERGAMQESEGRVRPSPGGMAAKSLLQRAAAMEAGDVARLQAREEVYRIRTRSCRAAAEEDEDETARRSRRHRNRSNRISSRAELSQPRQSASSSALQLPYRVTNLRSSRGTAR